MGDKDEDEVVYVMATSIAPKYHIVWCLIYFSTKFHVFTGDVAHVWLSRDDMEIFS